MILKPLLFALAFSGATLPGAAPAKDRHVILISLDLAPTIARLLNLDLPGADGRVLEEILTP